MYIPYIYIIYALREENESCSLISRQTADAKAAAAPLYFQFAPVVSSSGWSGDEAIGNSPQRDFQHFQFARRSPLVDSRACTCPRWRKRTLRVQEGCGERPVLYRGICIQMRRTDHGGPGGRGHTGLLQKFSSRSSRNHCVSLADLGSLFRIYRSLRGEYCRQRVDSLETRTLLFTFIVVQETLLEASLASLHGK